MSLPDMFTVTYKIEFKIFIVKINVRTWNAPPAALLVKLPVLASMESGVIVLDPQQTGLPPGLIGIDLPSLLLIKPPLTLVSSSPTT